MTPRANPFPTIETGRPGKITGLGKYICNSISVAFCGSKYVPNKVFGYALYGHAKDLNLSEEEVDKVTSEIVQWVTSRYDLDALQTGVVVHEVLEGYLEANKLLLPKGLDKV